MTGQAADSTLHRLKASVLETLRVQDAFFAHNWDRIRQVFDEVAAVLRSGGKLLIIGNGGSAADAQHLAAELVNRYESARPALPAVALTTDSSVLTSIGNDSDFRFAFSRQLEALGKPGDLLLAVSTSGNSPNVLEAVAQAKRLGIRTLAFTGGSGGRLKRLADLTLCVSSSTRTSRVQEALLVLEHLLCEWLEAELFSS
jgi:D-sedoheptulose 7-phosphate isomerase